MLGARVIGVELARELVNNFLAAKFTAEERHRRRVEKIKALERRYGKAARRERRHESFERAWRTRTVRSGWIIFGAI